MSHEPRKAPCCSRASRAYVEQVGSNRHGDGRPARAALVQPHHEQQWPRRQRWAAPAPGEPCVGGAHGRDARSTWAASSSKRQGGRGGCGGHEVGAGLEVDVVDDGPQPPAQPVALDGTADRSADGIARPRAAPAADARNDVTVDRTRPAACALTGATRRRCAGRVRGRRDMSARGKPPDHRRRARQADRRWRPLSRRALMTARPARVDMRCRKPWRFARLRLFGWYVRFTVSSLVAGPRGGRPPVRTSPGWRLRRPFQADAARPGAVESRQALTARGQTAPPRQSSPVHRLSAGHIARYDKRQNGELTPWMPVDRVLRCPDHGRSGSGGALVRGGLPAGSRHARVAKRGRYGSDAAVRPGVVHRVWTYLWTRTEPGGVEAGERSATPVDGMC